MQKGCECKISACAISFDSGLLLLIFYPTSCPLPARTLQPLIRGVFLFLPADQSETTVRQKKYLKANAVQLERILAAYKLSLAKKLPGGYKTERKIDQEITPPGHVMCDAGVTTRLFIGAHPLFCPFKVSMHNTSDCKQAGQQYRYPLNFDEVSP